MELFLDNDNIVRLSGLFDNALDEYVTDAVVKITIYDLNDVPLTGATWPITLVPDSVKPGDYFAVIPKEIPFVDKQKYMGEVIAEGGINAQWSIEIYGDVRIVR